MTAPRYAHLPLLHGPDGKKLSKRHGAASVQELRDAGYLPEAVRNYLALLGWGTDDDTTILATDELVERFSIERVGRASAIFDEKKLRWLNGRFMRELDLDRYVDAVAAQLAREGHDARGRRPRDVARRVRDRAGEGADARRGVAVDPLPVRASGRRREGPGKWLTAETAPALEAALAALEAIDEAEWDASRLESALEPLVERLGDQGARRLSAVARRGHRDDGLAGDLRDARRARA